jgi:hypothetical protein
MRADEFQTKCLAGFLLNGAFLLGQGAAVRDVLSV